MSRWLVQVLIAEYVVIALAFAWEHDWWRGLYFVSAAGISVAVLGMR